MIFNNKVQAYVTSLTGFFIRKGKKAKAESIFQNYVLKNMHSKKKNIYAVLNVCQAKTSTYVRIIARRRGKRVKFKVRLLKKSLGQRRGQLLVGRSLYANTRKNTRQFPILFRQDLENWSYGRHALKERYKDTHRTAKRHAPRNWFSKWRKSKFKKNLKWKNLTEKKKFVVLSCLIKQ